MPEPDPNIAALEARLDSLVRTQIDFQTEVTAIRRELTRLRGTQRPETADSTPLPPPRPTHQQTQRPPEPTPPPPPAAKRKYPRQTIPPAFGSYQSQGRSQEKESSAGKYSEYFNKQAVSARSDLEKFIGENLISKVGIIVLILGVGIGTKYAIDNEMISPLARIVLGYFFGFGLLGVAVWLKPNYHKFSAVLLSGGMAIMYFITFFAYSAYQLIDQRSSFALMVMFTIFTVVAAVVYNLQVIAHIGLVGAYAVPFLLSNDSGNYLALFAYVSILNIGVLAVAVKRYWRSLFYTSSAFTWAIFGFWLASKYIADTHLYLALGALAVFFLIFFATKLVHRAVHSESDHQENSLAIAATTVIFFLFSLGISRSVETTNDHASVFSFLAIASLVILLVSYRFVGRILVFIVYPFTWVIFGGWFVDHFVSGEHLVLASVFASVFFLIFYSSTLMYRLTSDKVGLPEMAGMMLTNSFIFYGVGYAILDSRAELQPFAGFFTVAHAAFHSVVAQIVSRTKQDVVDVVQILTILIITFATIAVPVQFDGNFVTLIWSVEAAALFYFGRSRQVRFFEYFAYPLMVLAAGSKALDWIGVYSERAIGTSELAARPFANGDMITGLVFVAAFVFIYFANTDSDKESVLDDALIKPLAYLTATVALFALYNTFRMEIGNFFHLQAVSVGSSIIGTPDLFRFNAVSQIDYTMLFLMVMAAVNLQKVRSLVAAYANVVLSLMTILIFVTAGMYLLYELRESYLGGSAFGLFGSPATNVLMRYFSYAFLAGMILSLFAYRRSDLIKDAVDDDLLTVAFDAIFYPSLLIVLSCELMNISAHLHVINAEKYGLSILWGIYSLALIAIGIAKSRKYLRIAGMALMAVTLVKLFFVDISDLGTIPKTILFVSLGLLLLIVSFLYNKYKVFIFGPGPTEDGKDI
jgi:uncharacterized membrane protein